MVWSGSDGEVVARLESAVLEVSAFRWPIRRSGWKARAQVDRLDLEALDRLFLQEDWRANGILYGPVFLAGAGERLTEIGLRLETAGSGGNVSSKLLARLIQFMPAGDTQAALLKALVSKTTFHFDVGKLELAQDGENHSLHLLLDGDHLFDITINIPRESVGVLNALYNIQEKR